MREWRLVSPWGIDRDGRPDDPTAAFHAGHLNDALRLKLPPSNPLLVASDTSGVWLIDENGGLATPLGWTWTAPHVNCLARGYYAEEHVYAGGDALYETDVTQPFPLHRWRVITLSDPNRRLLNIGTIYSAVVVYRRRALVLATSTGVWVAEIPVGPGGTYTALQATGPLSAPLPPSRYSSVAEGPGTSIIAACWGTNLTNAYGIFVGDWPAGGTNLEFHTRATIQGTPERQMLRTQIASSAADRRYAYAICGGSGVTPTLDQNGNPVPDGSGGFLWTTPDDFILRVLRSTDGGLTWTPTSDFVTGETLRLFPGGPGNDLAGHTQGGYNLCVGVSPFNRDIVAVGVVHFFVSTDGGQRWTHYSPADSAHRHEDTHACYFDPIDPLMLHICSDGGIATTPDLGKTWLSRGNRQLPNLQVTRAAVGSHDDGVVSASLQDNGDIAAPLYPLTDPWHTLPDDAGDGVLTLFAASGHLVYRNNTLASTDASGATVEYGAKPKALVWDRKTRQFSSVQMFPSYPLSHGVIPVDGTSDGLSGLIVADRVVTPDWTNSDGEPLQVVGAIGETVYGLFLRVDGTVHWAVLGNVPHQPSLDPSGHELPYAATACASPGGYSVFVGTSNGKLFRLDSATGTTVDLAAPIPDTASIIDIAAGDIDDVFVLTSAAAFRWDGTVWTPLASSTAPSLPTTRPFVAIGADRTAAPPRLFVANDISVWQSNDRGAAWFESNIKLPTVAMCKDLQTVIESSGAGFVYLATYGWSVFRLLTNAEDVSQTLFIDGHMDIVDRVAVGHDVWGHPTFTTLASVGSLHPLADLLVTGDNGDEVGVEVTLHLAWKLNGSVSIQYDALLLDLAEGEISDQTNGVRSVAFGATEAIVIDLVNDEWWPDRAHIEFVAKNF